MTDTTQAPAVENDARIVALICYGLFFLALANGITAVIGVVLAYIKRADSRGTIWESHFTNLIRVFWTTIVAIAVLIGVLLFGVFDILTKVDGNPDVPYLAVLVPGLFLVCAAFSVWYLYRTVRGFIRALDNKAC